MDIFDTFDSILLVRPETWWDFRPELTEDGRVLPMFLEEDDNDLAYS